MRNEIDGSILSPHKLHHDLKVMITDFELKCEINTILLREFSV